MVLVVDEGTRGGDARTAALALDARGRYKMRTHGKDEGGVMTSPIPFRRRFRARMQEPSTSAPSASPKQEGSSSHESLVPGPLEGRHKI